MSKTTEVQTLGSSLCKEIIDCQTEPDIDRSKDVLEALSKHDTLSIAVLQETKVGKALSKCIKTLRRHKRTSKRKEELEGLIVAAEDLLKKWKELADRESEMIKKKEAEEIQSIVGLPTSIRQYQARLTKQRKELFKNPPALPPHHIQVEEDRCPLPTRNKTTRELTFQCGRDESIKQLLRDFHPNRTPEEILRAGSFGGTYFRPIVSAVTNKSYNANEVLRDSVDSKWIEGLDKKTMLTSVTYRPSVNKYGVKCGGSLGMWESSGWISDADPYGWFQWYCRFYQGRRCADDERQIRRWTKSAGLKGRFRSQLCNKIIAAKAKPDDKSISPVIRQTLLHWGLEITNDVLDKHIKRTLK